ncbi:LysR family transcriptional regulator [Bordetella sp. N]|uniref:LysR family transcriptional regulator n=1 Tax=Bordetella sp. N TaxID=1746199 RepID=UPI00070D9D08|nr:LysR family transcriptional regulator [Bordetella sp. N]ALM82887.1 LysR family transcriptional regulator [Bordetella sp. N]
MQALDLTLLHLYVRIVDSGSLSAAALELGMTLSLASRRLQRLENTLGARLLHRTTRRQAMTAEGEFLYRHAVQILGQMSEIQERLTPQRRTVAGHIRVTAPVALGRRRIAPLLADFHREHPDLTVQLHLTDVLLDLVEAGMDLAIRFGRVQDSSYVSKPIAHNYRVLCASPAYLSRHGMPAHPTDLPAHRCLQIGQQAVAEWQFDGVPPLTVKIAARLVSNDGEVVHQWAVDGHGIAMKTYMDVAADLASGRLVRLLPDHPVPAAPLHAVYPHRKHLAPRIRAFLDYLTKHLRVPDEQWTGAA